MSSNRTQRTVSTATAPRFALGWASLVYAFATLMLAYPALGGRFLISPISDQYIGGFPVRDFAAQALHAGQGIPQWNPYIFGGLPYIAAMHGDIFYPTMFLRAMLPTDVAMTWGFVIHLFLAGLFAYMAIRAFGLGFWPALVGGLAYMMGGPIASFASPGHDGKLYVSALFPLALWALTGAIRGGRRSAWGILAITIGLAVLSPHPQLLQYMLLTCGAYALVLAFSRSPDFIATSDGVAVVVDRPTAIRRLAAAFGCVMLGAMMGAVQYWPVREYVDWSPRAGGFRAWEQATSYSFPPEELFNTFIPQFTGILEQYWGRNTIHFHSEYLGASVFVLALAGLGALIGRRRVLARFWTGALIVGLLWSLGGFTPFYRIVYALIPGTKFFRAPSTFFYIVGFAVAVLVALGVERLLAERRGMRSALVVAGVAAFLALLGSVGALTNMGYAIAGAERADAVAANAAALQLGAWRTFLFAALAAGIVWATTRGRLSARAASVALLAVIAVDLWSIERRYWAFSEPASVLYAEDAAIAELKKYPQPARVLALRLTNEMAPNDPFITGDALMVHKVRQILGYHGNELGRYQQLYGKNAPENAMLPRLIANRNFQQLTNMQFMLTNYPEPPTAGFQKVVGPVRNAAGTDTYLYRLTETNPLAWVVPLAVKAGDDTSLATILDPRFDVRRAAVFAPDAPVRATAAGAVLPPAVPMEVTTTSYAPGDVSLRLSAPAPAGSSLIVSENYYPGWGAVVDGRPAPLGRVNMSLIGVELPTGARDVRITFRSPAYETGKMITLLALAAGVALWAWGMFDDRRRRPVIVTADRG